MNIEQHVRAPAGARGWSPSRGWIYDGDELPESVEDDDYSLVVSSDGRIRGVQPHDRAPLVAVLRIEGDGAELVARVDDLADRVAGQDVAEATDIRILTARTDALVHRVTRLETSA